MFADDCGVMSPEYVQEVSVPRLMLHFSSFYSGEMGRFKGNE